MNEDGHKSAFSGELLFALGALPSTPAAPTKILDQSKENSIVVTWVKITGDTLPIFGYKVYADSGRNDDFVLAYDGTNKPEINSFEFLNANPDFVYRFKVTALNFNGEGTASAISELRACTVPSGINTPTLHSVTSTKITINWETPSNDGGCLITGYRILVDDGAGGSFTEYDAANVNDKPFLTQYEIDLSSGTVGNTYRLEVAAKNIIGEVISDTLAVILASVPNQPSAATSTSDGKDLTVHMTIPASNGGSEIISY